MQPRHIAAFLSINRIVLPRHPEDLSVVAEQSVAVMLLLPIAFLLFALCIWIVVPPPNDTAIVATVVAIELSPYLLLLNLGLLVAAMRSRARLRLAAATLAVLSIAICSLPIASMLRAGLRPALPSTSFRTSAVIEWPIPVTLGVERTAMLAYVPKDGTKHPIVFTIYGGAWQRGSPEKDASLDRALAGAGYAVFALDYRQAPEYRYPSALDDVRKEVALVLNNADDYRADRSRVAILGHSSGGELAELCAFAPHAPFRALISYSGAIDLVNGYKITPTPDPIDVRSVISLYMGATPDQDPQGYRSASPLYQVRRGLPPTLLIYADRDHVVEFASAEMFRDALRNDGDDVTFLELPWTEHGFEEVPFGLHAPIALRAVEEFLQRTL
jgi:acetyl esterase/lipase